MVKDVVFASQKTNEHTNKVERLVFSWFRSSSTGTSNEAKMSEKEEKKNTYKCFWCTKEHVYIHMWTFAYLFYEERKKNIFIYLKHWTDTTTVHIFA